MAKIKTDPRPEAHPKTKRGTNCIYRIVWRWRWDDEALTQENEEEATTVDRALSYFYKMMKEEYSDITTKDIYVLECYTPANQKRR